MIHFDAKLVPAPEMVVLRELEKANVSKGGFYLSDDALKNARSGFCVVEAVGSVAFDKTKLKRGDYVYADRLASYYHTEPIMVMKWDNILLLTDENKSNLSTMPGWVLMTMAKEESAFVLATEDASSVRHGIVKSINYGDTKIENCPFSAGDDVLITRQCDIYDGFGPERLVAMKISEVIARFDYDGGRN